MWLYASFLAFLSHYPVYNASTGMFPNPNFNIEWFNVHFTGLIEGKRKIWTAACWLKYSKNMQMIPLIFINFLLGYWWRTLNLFKWLFCICQVTLEVIGWKILFLFSRDFWFSIMIIRSNIAGVLWCSITSISILSKLWSVIVGRKIHFYLNIMWEQEHAPPYQYYVRARARASIPIISESICWCC